jgi:serine/threonine protein kinase
LQKRTGTPSELKVATFDKMNEDPAPPATPTTPMLSPSKSGWKKVKMVVSVHRMVAGFKTLNTVVNLTDDNALQWSDFELVRNLGSGAFGVVNAYRCKSSGRTLAVKVLNGQAGASPEAIADLEARGCSLPCQIAIG